jgi:regulatory protein
LQLLNYVDDAAFARQWSLFRANGRGYGPKRIEQELRSKGIDADLIRTAISAAFEPGDERLRAKMALEKKFKGVNFNDPKMFRRAGAFLQRRGFSTGVVFDLLHQAVKDE